jgi:hypothetical protein
MTKKDDLPLADLPPGKRKPKLEPDQLAAASDQEPAPPPERKKLALPKGAFIAFRKSGGIEFSSREMVVYPDGRIIYDSLGVQKHGPERPRKLNDAQIIQLRRTLEQANFFRLQSGEGEQSGDVFAYEIVARLGSRTNDVEFFTGNIPEVLEGLIQRLTELMQ